MGYLLFVLSLYLVVFLIWIGDPNNDWSWRIITKDYYYWNDGGNENRVEYTLKQFKIFKFINVVLVSDYPPKHTKFFKDFKNKVKKHYKNKGVA